MSTIGENPTKLSFAVDIVQEAHNFEVYKIWNESGTHYIDTDTCISKFHPFNKRAILLAKGMHAFGFDYSGIFTYTLLVNDDNLLGYFALDVNSISLLFKNLDFPEYPKFYDLCISLSKHGIYTCKKNGTVYKIVKNE